MKTDKIEIRSDLTGSKIALETAEKFIAYNDIKGKDAIHIRLLTEEALSLINGIMENIRAELRIESEKTAKGLLCTIRLTAKKGIDPLMEDRLKSISTSGKNENARGILGKIREMFRISMQYNAEGVYSGTSLEVNSWYNLGMSRDKSMNDDAQYWSLMTYTDRICEKEKKSSEEWDELEKSIIAKLADDVKVWLKSNSTEVVIEKLIKA
jgi:hypothetical protein